MKISIIIPVYNMEEKLTKCLNSIVGQSYNDLEIIVINDGSKDNSLSILKEYAKKDSRIIIIDQENQGISAARNNGIRKSTGKYLGFVDSDDYVEKDMFKSLLDNLIQNNSDISICDYFIGNEEDKRYMIVGNDCMFGGSLYDHPELIRQIDFAPWNKLYKVELFDKIEFPLQTKYEDFETILKVFSKAKKISKVNEPLYDYYVNPNGETNTINRKNLDMFKICLNLITYFDFDSKDKELKNYFFMTASEKLMNSFASAIKVTTTKECFEYINDTYKLLDENCSNWKTLYMSNQNINHFTGYIRSHKFLIKTYVMLRHLLKKIIKR